jgi:translation initiation factor IF-1
MVKNVGGGNKSKGFARKNFVKKDTLLRVSEDEAEIYAQVTKMCGGRICLVIAINGVEMVCHIRGKFAGRGKRDNFIETGTWLLVGLREWEKEKEKSVDKPQNCDIIEVYSNEDKNKLKNNITDVNWNLFIMNDNKQTGGNVKTNEFDDGITFADEKTQEFQELIEIQSSLSKTGVSSSIITTDDGEVIDVDDI